MEDSLRKYKQKLEDQIETLRDEVRDVEKTIAILERESDKEPQPTEKAA